MKSRGTPVFQDFQYGDRFSSTQNQKKECTLSTMWAVGSCSPNEFTDSEFSIPNLKHCWFKDQKFSELEIVNSESVKPYGEQLDLHFYNFTYIPKFILIFFSVVKERMKDCEKMCNITRTDVLAKYRNQEK